jgi:hypothetical protein
MDSGEEDLMSEKVRIDDAYVPSEDVVASEIEGETVLVPLVSSIGDVEDEICALSGTGQAIWRKLEGTRPLGRIAAELAEELAAPVEEIERDVLGFVGELVARRMVVRKD